MRHNINKIKLSLMIKYSVEILIYLRLQCTTDLVFHLSNNTTCIYSLLCVYVLILSLSYCFILVFMSTAILNFLLGVYARYPSSPMGERALETVLFTLKAMANGGMHDHVGQV